MGTPARRPAPPLAHRLSLYARETYTRTAPYPATDLWSGGFLPACISRASAERWSTGKSAHRTSRAVRHPDSSRSWGTRLHETQKTWTQPAQSLYCPLHHFCLRWDLNSYLSSLFHPLLTGASLRLLLLLPLLLESVLSVRHISQIPLRIDKWIHRARTRTQPRMLRLHTVVAAMCTEE
jgi:hypothetical protein